MNNVFGKKYTINSNKNYTVFLGILLFTCIELFVQKKYFPENKELQLMSHLSIIASIFATISLCNYSFIRISYYFLVYQIVYAPQFITLFKGRLKKIIGFCLVIGCILFYTFIIKFNDGTMMPYQFFWM